MAVDRRLVDLIMGHQANETFPFAEPVQPPRSSMGSVFGSLAPANALLPAVRPPQPAKRMAYFAFDFDDVMRVNNVRQSGKIGYRIMPRSRGFLDRSVWESRNINTAPGLKQLMQGAMKFSSVVCVLVGTNTWFSRWVRYEIALAVVNERGLMAVDLNSINHNHSKAPDRLGINPLNFMGVRKDESGSWHLVERAAVEFADGNVGFIWRWYEDYQPPVPRPKFVPESEAGIIVPLSARTERYDFISHNGSKNIGSWLDMAALAAGR
jgi:hypothetical protein